MPNMVQLQYEIGDWEIQQSEGGAAPNGKPNFWSQGNLPYPAFNIVGTHKDNPEQKKMILHKFLLYMHKNINQKDSWRATLAVESRVYFT